MPHEQTLAYRAAQAALAKTLIREQLRLWPLLDATRLDETFPAWLAASRALIVDRRTTAAALARLYVAQLRSAQRVAGDAPRIADVPVDSRALNVSLTVTSLVSIKQAMSRLVPLDVARDTAFVAMSGVSTRFVANAGSDVIRESVRRDRRARGWLRVTSGAACDYCDELAASGTFASEDDMARHDHCLCVAEPAYA